MQMSMTRVLNYSYFILNILVSLGFIMKGKPALIANTVATSSFFLGVIFLERYTLFKLENYIRILLIVTLISHSLFGEYLRAYYTTGYFDKGLHLFGTFSFALLAYEILNTFMIIQASRPQLFKFILVSTLGICVGTFFELIEFVLDQLLNERNQFGLIDTDLDLLFNVIGAYLAGIFIIKRLDL